MANNIEWHEATEWPQGYTPEELTEVSYDGDNDEGYIGVGSGDTMLYGTVKDIITWFERALVEVKRVHGIVLAEKKAAAELNIRSALSRDDSHDHDDGSDFEDKVAIIRSLNVDSIASEDRPKPDPLNYEYCRGQVELLMDTTSWFYRPEKEDVWLYIFGQEM
jgi:hypothetical protein